LLRHFIPRNDGGGGLLRHSVLRNNSGGGGLLKATLLTTAIEAARGRCCALEVLLRRAFAARNGRNRAIVDDLAASRASNTSEAQHSFNASLQKKAPEPEGTEALNHT